MKYPVAIDPQLYAVYPEIRLGLLCFRAEVQPSRDAFQKFADAQEVET